MDYIIKSYEGVGNIRLGMNSDQIQEIMSVGPRKFHKNRDDEYYTDAYETFYVYYKSPGICEAIEFFRPSNITFNGVKLLSKPYSELVNYFASLDKNIEKLETGIISYKAGISIYAPFAETEPLTPPEGIMIFEKGYYD